MSNNTTVLVVPGPKVVTVLGIPSVYTGPISPTRGGTGLSSYVIGDLLYASASNALAALAGNVTATRQFLTSTGTGSAAQAPAWAALAASDIPAGIDAAKIGGGTISSAEFACLEGATSPLQAQLDTATTGAAAQFSAIGTSLNNKSDVGHTHDAAAIVTGTVAPVRLGSGTPTSSTLLDGSGAWRPLTGSDIPQHSAALLNSGTLDVARLNSGTNAQFVRADGVNSGTLLGFLTSYGLNLDVNGVGTGNSRQIVGHSTVGVIYNTPVGLRHELRSNGATLGYFQTDYAYLYGTSGVIDLCGNTRINGGGINLASGAGNGSLIIGSGDISIGSGRVILGNAASIPTGSNAILGTSLGTTINSATGLSNRIQVAGVTNANFGSAFGTASASSWAVGQYGSTTTTAGQSGIGSNGGTVWYNTTTNNTHDFRIQNVQHSIFGAAFGTVGASRFAIGQYAVGTAVATQPGIGSDGTQVYHNVPTGGGHSILVNNAVVGLFQSSLITFLAPIALGNAYTVTPGSNQIVGTANGVQINAPTGSTVALSTNGTTRASVGLNGLVFASGATTAAPGNISIGSGAGATMSLNVPSGGLYLFGENGTSGVVIAAASQYLRFRGKGGILGAAGNAGHCYIAGGNVAANSSCAYIRVYGVSASSNAGQAVYACGNVAGAKHSFVDGSGTERLTIDETALTISKPVNLGNASTVTAANNQIVGTSTGPKVNSTSGQYVEILNGNTVCAQFGRGALGAAARWWNIGGYASGGSYDNTLFGIDATSVSGTINIGTSGQFQVWSAGSATALLRFGYALGTANVGAWGIGRWASSQTATSSGLGSTGDGNMSANVANSGRIDIGANGTTRRAMQHVGGVIIGDLGSQVTIANSSTTTLMTATNRYGRLEIFDNTGQWATIRLANAATPVLEAGSANFAITASPTSAQLGINLSAGSLQLIAGSAAATTISANFRGM